MCCCLLLCVDRSFGKEALGKLWINDCALSELSQIIS